MSRESGAESPLDFLEIPTILTETELERQTRKKEETLMESARSVESALGPWMDCFAEVSPMTIDRGDGLRALGVALMGSELHGRWMAQREKLELGSVAKQTSTAIKSTFRM